MTLCKFSIMAKANTEGILKGHKIAKFCGKELSRGRKIVKVK
jgi:hypothetical protein